MPSPAPANSPALDPEGVDWRALDPRYVRVRLVETAVGTLVRMAVAALPLAAAALGWFRWPLWLLLALPAIVLAWGLTDLVLTPRRVHAMGYAERDDDLLIRRGLLFRRMTVVPYGRMQYVDVSVGPIEGAFGLATVRLHTAAAATKAEIPGLPAEEAGRLREQLVARGEARLAGL